MSVCCVSAQAVFARGISAAWENYICVGEYLFTAGNFKMRFQKIKNAALLCLFFFFVGVSSGALLVFDIPSKGSNITLSEVLEEHKEAITDLASECSGSQVWLLLSRVCIHFTFMYIVHEL